MASRQWRERLEKALHRQRLPSDYIQRLVEELSDHAADLFLEETSMDAQPDLDARLGTPEQLAAAAKAEFRRRTFAGRHPLLTFLGGPLLAVSGIFLASAFGLVGICWLLDVISGGTLSANDAAHLPPPAWEMTLMQVCNWVVRFAPCALSGWFFARLGRRTGLRGWSIAACVLVALMAVLYWSIMSRSADGGGMWLMGVGWRGWQLGFDQVLQAAVPLALACWILRRGSTPRWQSLAT